MNIRMRGSIGPAPHRPLFAWFVALLLLCSPLAHPAPCAAAEATRPAWNCLPRRTLVALRIPDGTKALEALRAQTKMGATLFSAERLERFTDLLAEQNADEWQKAKQKLAEYGLTTDDVPRLFAGASGFALLLEPTDAGKPMPMGLAWIEPGEKLAARVMSATAKAVKDEREDGRTVKRLDFELEGHRVMHLAIPAEGPAGDDWPDNFDELDEDEQERQMEQWNERQKQAPDGAGSVTHVMLTRMGGRLLMANSFEPSADDGEDMQSKRLTSTFARFLQAHGEDEPAFAAHVEGNEGVADTLPAGGVNIFEMFADLANISALAEADPQAARAIEALGLGTMGVMAMRSALQGSVADTGFFMEAPAPRKGIMELFEQSPLPSEPPAWVPADLVSYGHTSADLGKMYTKIKQMILNSVEDRNQMAMPLQMAEGWIQGLTGADLATVLSAFGNKHMVLTFEPPQQDAPPEAGPDAQMTLQNTGIVWQVTDEQVLGKLLQQLAVFGNAAGITAVTEQGYSGYRFGSMMEGGLMLGKGHMVLAIGAGVLEQTLSALNNPPKGADSLRGSDTFQRAQKLLKLRPAQSFQIMDGRRYSKLLGRTFAMMFSQLAGNGDPDAQAMIEGLKELLPTTQQMQNMLGTSVSTMHISDLGIVARAISELPPP